MSLPCNLQHTLLFEPDADKDTPRVGMIDPHCKVKSVIMEAFQNAAFLCEEYYDCAPDIEIKGGEMLLWSYCLDLYLQVKHL